MLSRIVYGFNSPSSLRSSSSLLRNVFANAHTIATSRAVLYI